MDLQEVGWGGVGWIAVAPVYGQVADACECGNEPLVSIKCREFLD